jgi:F0F1-type ATP synthase membrane subunit a
MVSTELLVISIVRALVEVAGMFLLGQGVLYLFAGAKRHTNAVYRLFQIVTGPVVRFVRIITPKAIVDRHVPVVAFFLLFWVWIALAWLRRVVCAADGLAC